MITHGNRIAVVLLAIVFLLGMEALPSLAAPPMCPHVNHWYGNIEAWSQGTPWIKVMSKEDVVRAKNVAGAKIYYRPFDVPNTDQGWCTDGTAMANAVVANLIAIGSSNWPDAISYRNEFNNDTQVTPQEFIEYYDIIRASGYNGLIVFGSWAVWWPNMSDWADSDIIAAVEKADALEFHEYFDLTVACQQYILCHRHVESIRQYPYLGYKPIFIGECGSDRVTCNDPANRRGWNDQGKLTPEQYRDQLAIYRNGCGKQVVACFIFQQGAINDWWDFEIISTPTVRDWCPTTWTNSPGYATGYVRDSGSQPISGAIVTSTTNGISVKTNSQGKYWLYNLTPGTNSITASKIGYANVTTNVSITSNGTASQNFTMNIAAAGGLTGTVKDTSNNIITGATVSTNVGGHITTTNGSGVYSFSPVAPGTYSVTASKAGFQTAMVTGKTVTCNNTTTANLTLVSNFQGILNGNMEGGSFLDPDGDHKTANFWHRFALSGVSKTDVVWGGAHGGNYSQGIWETNWIAGIYQQVGGITAGNKYTASVWVKGTDSAVRFWIGIDPTGGSDAGSANVQWSPEQNGSSTWTQISKQVTATADTITVFLKARNTSTSLNKYAYLDDANLTDDGPGTPPDKGVISGNVKNNSGVNLSGATVSTTSGGYSTTTDANGNYTIGNVTPATYSVVASKAGYNSQTQTGKTVTAGQTTTCNFTLTAQTGTISGNVKNASLQNLSGATVSTTTGGFTTTTDANGNYTLANVLVGTYDVMASKAGYVAQTQTGKTVSNGATTTVNFTLQIQTNPFSSILNKNFEGGFYNSPDSDHSVANNYTKFILSGNPKYNGPWLTNWHSGNYGQMCYESSYTMGIYQQATYATQGRNYTASVWVKGGDADLKFWVGIDPAGGTDATSANVQWSAQAAPGNVWTQISKQVAASNSTITMFIKTQNVSALNKYASIDDADLVEN